MKSAALCIAKPEEQNRKPGFFSDYTKRVLLKLLDKLQHGELILNDGNEQYIFGRQDERLPKTIVIDVHDRSTGHVRTSPA